MRTAMKQLDRKHEGVGLSKTNLQEFSGSCTTGIPSTC